MSRPNDPRDNLIPPDSKSEDDSQDSSESQFLTAETPYKTQSRSELDPAAALPKTLGQYQIEAVLGSGGMGQVLKAFDPKLGRYAALKLLRGETPELTRRFAQEARVQAKIDHENVCKVYEVGETEGKQFIAMQFIPGKTFGAASKQMTLEEKIRILKQVADALQAAHKEGMIHRDVKPSNIMVVQDEGRWRPYIMDFGLAREQESAGLTMTGLVMGTPHYMAPEQARGETSRLDRRTDIYSLGATMYEILSGKTPFHGNTSAEVLIKVLQEEPLPIRKMDSSIPVDLETIVMKCMEKEPQRRYESAKALAEDLQRYLEGEPIAARPIPWSQRLFRKARKNKVATGILGAAVFITLVLLGSLIWVQTKSNVQSRYARDFGEEVRSIESMIRGTYAAPLHDIRQELSLARTRLAKLEARTREAGTWAYGPGHNALGLGYFALDDYDKAFQNLQIAWNSNYREASTAYALGKVLGIRYQKALREAEMVKNKMLRQEQKTKIEKELRDPAVEYLKIARSRSESPAYTDGLIAFYQARYGDALKKAIEANRQAGWSYDAKKLEGDLYLTSGRDLEEKGELEKSKKHYEAAGAAYQTAIDLGRSRAEIYISEAERWTTILNQDSEKGVSNEAVLKQALHMSDQAIAINPDAPEGYSRKMKVYTSAGTYMMYNTGEDPRPIMEQAIAMGKEVLKRSPNDLVVFEQTGTAYRAIGEYEIRHGMDPRKALALSIENNQRSLKIKPNNPPVLTSCGVAYSIMGEYEWKHGLDPRSTFQKALQQYRSSQQINPNYGPAFTNGGVASWYIASYEAGRGIDPRASFDQAIRQYQAVIKMNPNEGYAIFNQSLAFMDAGTHEMRVGRDPTNLYKRSLDALQKSAQLVNNAYVHSALGTIHYLMAARQLDLGHDPTSLLHRARMAYRKSMEIDRSYYEPVGFLGRAETLAARWAMRTGASPTPYIELARKALQKAIELNKEEGALYQLTAELCRWEAEWMQSGKRPARLPISNGLHMVEKALSLDSESADAYAVQGTLYILQSAEEKDRTVQLESARLAQTSLEKALTINRWLEREYNPLLKKANGLTKSP